RHDTGRADHRCPFPGAFEGGSWLDSEANDVQAFCGPAVDLGATEDACEGEPLPLAPEFTVFAVLNGSIPVGSRGGEIFGNLSYTWEDDSKGDWLPEDLAVQKVRFLDQTDIVIGYQEQNWMFSGYVENVFNNTCSDRTFGEDFDLSPYPQYVFGPARPRTAGIRASYSFWARGDSQARSSQEHRAFPRRRNPVLRKTAGLSFTPATPVPHARPDR
ncbi:MAG: hypothetical protein RIC38_10105, partial [Chromatocurvus sp.]